MHVKKLLLAFLSLSVTTTIFTQTEVEWQTWWEKSDYLETPRYKETIEFSQQLADASEMINYGTFGVSPQGRDLAYLILDKDGLSSPDEIRAKERIIVMVEAAIHPGESEGKDAMLALFRDIIIHNTHNEFLDDVSVLFIPIFNVDGHERFTPYSRINQNGPTEGGWRTTAHNLNLNRDFVKADAPEMQAWLRLFSKWEPEFFIDCHTTDGADYQYTLTYAVEGYSNKMISNWIEKEYIPEISEAMDKVEQPIFPYVMFRRWHDPRSGLFGGLASPRFSNGYSAVRNRPGLLIETHMLKDYKTRVIATYEMVYYTLRLLQPKKAELVELIDKAETYAASEKFRESPCVLKYSLSETDSTMVTFKGIDYTVEKSDLSGGNWFRYNGKEMDFELPFYNTIEPEIEVELPEAYIIPVQWQNIIDRLEWHGIKYYTLSDSENIEFETYKFKNVEWRQSPYEGRFSIQKLDIEPIKRNIRFEKGSVVVPMNQANSYLIAFMFEPASEESFLRWGFFNTIFEQKEYVESYVMEEMAREMIKETPSLKDDFEKWKSENSDVQNDSYAQLMWFYRQTPYFDTELNVYPIGRIASKEQLDKILK
jgi:hypothetical protein